MEEKEDYKNSIISIDLNECISLCESAAKRTRWIIIVLVIASVIIAVGFFNSTDWSFATRRMKLLDNFENTPINNQKTRGTKPLLDSYFGKYDFNNFKGFVCDEIKRNSTRENSLQEYLFNGFNEESKNELKEQCDKPELDAKLVSYLYEDFNRILKDKFLYQQFKLENLKGETARLWQVADSAPGATFNVLKETDVIRLNRLLLESVYFNYINKSSNIIPYKDDLRPKETAKFLAYTQNVQYVGIPSFGNSIDINELGIIGGVSLIIILLLLRYSLSREIKNFNFSFRQAFYRHGLRSFYHSLAMRLVITIPQMEKESPNQSLSAGAKYICFLPLIVIGFGFGYDYYSIYELGVYEAGDLKYHLIIEGICVLIILYLSLRCLERLIHIDEIWEDYYFLIKESTKLPPGTELDKSDPKIKKAIYNRVEGKSKHGIFAHSKSKRFRWLGKRWFIRLLTIKNIARMMPWKNISLLLYNEDKNTSEPDAERLNADPTKLNEAKNEKNPDD